MTTLDPLPVQTTAPPSTPRSRSKSVLFCPSCGHESELNGDWTLEMAGNTTTYRCPECRTVVNERTDD